MDPRMMAIGGQLIGGYLMGQQQREARLEEQKLKQQQMKMMMEAAKLKNAQAERTAAAEERKQQLLASIFGPELAGGQQAQAQPTSGSGPQFGTTFGVESSQATQPKPQSRLLDIISDPLKAAALKEMTGVDMLGAHNAMRQGQAEQRQMLEHMYRMQRDQTNWQREDFYRGQETHPPLPITGAGGTESVVYPKKYQLGQQPPVLGGGGGPPAMGGGGGMPGIQTRPGAENMPILAGEMDNWVKIDPQKGTIVRPDFSKHITRKQLTDQGFKFAAKDAQDAIAAFSGVENTLSVLEGMMEEIFPKDEGPIERIPGAISRKGGSVTQINPKAAEYEKFLSGTLAPMIRALGEKGALANEDVTRALNMFPKLTDSGKVAWSAINNVRSLIVGQKKSRLGDIAPDTKALTLPPQAAKMLKEGQVTKFGNGQAWTLMNGVPKRIE